MGGAAVAALAIGLAGRWASFVPAALVLLGGAYALTLEPGRGTVDGGALLVAPALLVAAELAYWSLEPTSIPPERGLTGARLAALGATVAASTLAAAILVGTSTIEVAGTAALLAVGVLAATGALALTARLARRG